MNSNLNVLCELQSPLISPVTIWLLSLFIWRNGHRAEWLGLFALWPQRVIWRNGHRVQWLGLFGLYLWPLWVKAQWLGRFALRQLCVRVIGWFALLFGKFEDINSKQESSEGLRFVVVRTTPTSGFLHALGVLKSFLVRLWQVEAMNFLRNIAWSLRKINELTE